MSNACMLRSMLVLALLLMQRDKNKGATATSLAISRTPWTGTSCLRLPNFQKTAVSSVSRAGEQHRCLSPLLFMHGRRDRSTVVGPLAMSGPMDGDPHKQSPETGAARDSMSTSSVGGISREYFIVGGSLGVLGLGYVRGLQDERAYRIRKRNLFKTIAGDGNDFRDILEVGVGGNPKVGGFSNLGFYRPGQRIVGIDPALSGKPSLNLDLAEKKAKAKGLTLRGVGGVAEDLPFESGSFDAVVSTLVFCSVKDPAAALREVSRVLRPGGKFLFVEHIHAPEEGSSILGLRQQQDLLDPLQQVLADGCHLTRETDRLIRDASSESPGSRLFSRIESLESVRINSMWPISVQVFGVVVK